MVVVLKVVSVSVVSHRLDEVVPNVPETLVSGTSNLPIEMATRAGVAASSRHRDSHQRSLRVSRIRIASSKCHATA
jgi:hypothetical protein